MEKVEEIKEEEQVEEEEEVEQVEEEEEVEEVEMEVMVVVVVVVDQEYRNIGLYHGYLLMYNTILMGFAPSHPHFLSVHCQL